MKAGGRKNPVPPRTSSTSWVFSFQETRRGAARGHSIRHKTIAFTDHYLGRALRSVGGLFVATANFPQSIRVRCSTAWRR